MSGIPDYKDLILPFLHLLEDGQPYEFNSIIERLAVILNLTDSDKSELVKCGRQYKYKNRIITARTYLLKAKFIDYDTDRNIFITEKGKEYLNGVC